ncbi:hypothetical protein BO78DRAFT_116637 [Aspergillus sclerotiicarbonarius CBS 121057]|uniref:Uncharacterized protein n=1 Tax=Aspergillus sclerotiicarbonarius (strain CBS 121057 / IBT 28362) TaxID=1448318 RepID=A0A319EWE1_ASPSB|nr:hypothetical protein BO78DRAFT_116637 [Aspergillus sclerotiicarbonarius CBS 121057]
MVISVRAHPNHTLPYWGGQQHPDPITGWLGLHHQWPPRPMAEDTSERMKLAWKTYYKSLRQSASQSIHPHTLRLTLLLPLSSTLSILSQPSLQPELSKMLNLKVFVVAALLLAGQAIAGRISYRTHYTTGNVDGNGGNDSKSGGRITDEQQEEILKNIGTWSDNRLTASVHEPTGLLTVTSPEVETKGQASTANQNAQHLIKQHI